MKVLYDTIREWLYTYKRNSVKKSSFDRLETSLNALKDYRIANIRLIDLCAEDIQKYINKLVADGYALSTIKKQYFLVRAYLEYAVTEGIIARPIYNNVSLPAKSIVKKPEKEIEVYAPDEQRALVKVLQTRSRVGYYAAWLMLETGLRIGEALALDWTDVLWRRKAIRVSKTLIRISNSRRTEVQNEPKSHTSKRIVPMSTVAMRFMRELYELTDNPVGFIFASQNGTPITYEAMRYQIQTACKEAGVPYLGQHVFRHTFATNCYDRGCDVKILSKLLGHSDVTITYNIYIHLFGDELEELRSVVG